MAGVHVAGIWTERTLLCYHLMRSLVKFINYSTKSVAKFFLQFHLLFFCLEGDLDSPTNNQCWCTRYFSTSKTLLCCRRLIKWAKTQNFTTNSECAVWSTWHRKCTIVHKVSCRETLFIYMYRNCRTLFQLQLLLYNYPQHQQQPVLFQWSNLHHHTMDVILAASLQ
jgi:hypothetical protein